MSSMWKKKTNIQGIPNGDLAPLNYIIIVPDAHISLNNVIVQLLKALVLIAQKNILKEPKS